MVEKLKYYKKIIDLECILNLKINKRKYQYINQWLKNIELELKKSEDIKDTNEVSGGRYYKTF